MQSSNRSVAGAGQRSHTVGLASQEAGYAGIASARTSTCRFENSLLTNVCGFFHDALSQLLFLTQAENPWKRALNSIAASARMNIFFLFFLIVNKKWTNLFKCSPPLKTASGLNWRTH